MNVDFYTKKGCPLCDKGYALLKELADSYSLVIQCHDIYQDDVLLEKYQLKIPVVCIDGQEIGYGLLEKESLQKQIERIRSIKQ
ncbi:glutaredoxin family protein [Shouchella clausii]|jgi:glutaredoxin|uniref:glutaredoxin family protein n=1 Tax=Shouchella TaxID=2893057 RepID=UPI0004E67D1B|nr:MULTISPECIES: glutaredoxin family protein [Shouchella]MCM3313567.1 glutaredoxin family protein [Psychrobacillus sp. MER TA 17]ALA54101.1 glutaredoxin family protein [Shouchella clausii]KKI85385.1 glutaredoxin [Shouchella clausii]MBU3229347.1 glutaredoxin family protein [Shouchella clausii]MBU3265431.1 glutaredoxin family protein [Shouchella clausii]